jgi:hypothetical protein
MSQALRRWRGLALIHSSFRLSAWVRLAFVVIFKA